MKSARVMSHKRIPTRLPSRYFGAALVLLLSPFLLLLTGTSAEGETYANVELGFSLLALAAGSVCVAGLVSNAYDGLLEAPLPTDSPLLRLPPQPECAPGDGPEERSWLLPVVLPSLVLPTLISGLGGWVAPPRLAPCAEARPSAA